MDGLTNAFSPMRAIIYNTKHMTSIEKYTFLKQNIERRIDSTDKNRRSYRYSTYLIFFISTTLSAITAVLLGLDLSNLKDEVRITALILTTLIGVCNVYSAFSNDRDLWIANNTSRNRLLRLKFELEYLAIDDKDIADDKLDDIRYQYQAILDELNSLWEKKRTVVNSK
jgi:hypothetical protein